MTKNNELRLARTRSVTVLDHEATGRAIRTARVRSKRSLRSIARDLNVSATFLSDLERGLRHWTPTWVRRVTEAISSPRVCESPVVRIGPSVRVGEKRHSNRTKGH